MTAASPVSGNEGVVRVPLDVRLEIGPRNDKEPIIAAHQIDTIAITDSTVTIIEVAITRKIIIDRDRVESFLQCRDIRHAKR